jgi:hypothetical protein
MQIDTYKALKICSPLLSFMTMVLNIYIYIFQKDINLKKHLSIPFIAYLKFKSSEL